MHKAVPSTLSTLFLLVAFRIKNPAVHLHIVFWSASAITHTESKIDCTEHTYKADSML